MKQKLSIEALKDVSGGTHRHRNNDCGKPRHCSSKSKKC